MSSTSPDPVDGGEVELLRAEVDRLRLLVGPTEAGYADLRRDLLAARDLARGAEAAVGALRGKVAELEFEIIRARQAADVAGRAPLAVRARRALRPGRR